MRLKGLLTTYKTGMRGGLWGGAPRRGPWGDVSTWVRTGPIYRLRGFPLLDMLPSSNTGTHQKPSMIGFLEISFYYRCLLHVSTEHGTGLSCGQKVGQEQPTGNKAIHCEDLKRRGNVETREMPWRREMLTTWSVV